MGIVQACQKCVQGISRCDRDAADLADHICRVDCKEKVSSTVPGAQGLPSLIYEDAFKEDSLTVWQAERQKTSSVDTNRQALDTDFETALTKPFELQASAGASIGKSPSTSSTGPRRVVSRRMSRVAAGHGGTSILKEFQDEQEEMTGIPEYIIKVYDECEAANYAALQEKPDPIQKFVAHYAGDVWKDQAGITFTPEEVAAEGGDGKDEKFSRYMRLSNLLRKYTRGPHVMDCKIGLRSFAESEVLNKKLRPDLFERMLELDPSAPNEEEREKKACTKHRWMTFNDALTKLPELGLRVDGIAHSGEVDPKMKKDLKKATSVPELASVVAKYFLPHNLGEGVALDSTTLRRRRISVADSVISDLQELKLVLEESQFVRTHEFVGSSLLFVADAHGPFGGAFLIDFAKASRLPEGITIDHKSPWREGNHEDGLFIGVRTATEMWEMVRETLRTGTDC